MEENKNNETSMDEDLQEVIIEELATEEDSKKRLKRRIFNLIYDVLILVGIACLLYGGYSLYEGYRDSKEAEESHEELKDNYVTVPTLPAVPDDPNKPNDPDSSDAPDGSIGSENVETQVPDRPREWYEQIRVDLVGMQTNINPDIVGWIHFENETISYPLLYSEDNAEYQRVRYDLVYSRGGSIFLEETNSWDLSDIRNVIYGHNMKDLSMFGKLKYYNDKKNYYEDHQYFQLLYDGMVYRYQIFSYFTIHQNEVNYINTNFEKGSDAYGKFLQKLVENSKRDTGVEVDANDKTVTLVTCSKDNTYRFIVSAVLVDQHTMANADGTFPEEPDTEEPGTDEPDTDEPDTDEPGTDEPGTDEPDTDEPDTGDPSVRPGADTYTYTDIGKTMMATVSVKIRNKPSTEGVKIAILGKHNEVYVEAVCNETGWYRVRYGTNFRRIGYINGKYLTEENLHLKNPVFGGTADAHTKCGDCGDALSADHVLVETTTEAGTIVYVCECGYMTETPPESGTEEPGTDEPGTDEPGTDEPGTDEPGTEEPGTDEPGTDEPGTDEPGTDEPGTDEPGSEEPSESESETPGEEPNESESQSGSEEPSESESQSGGEEPSESESQSASDEPSEAESQDVGEEPSESENSLEPTE